MSETRATKRHGTARHLAPPRPAPAAVCLCTLFLFWVDKVDFWVVGDVSGVQQLSCSSFVLNRDRRTDDSLVDGRTDRMGRQAARVCPCPARTDGRRMANASLERAHGRIEDWNLCPFD